MFVLDSFLDLKYSCRIILWRRFSSSLNKLDVSVVIVEIWCTRPRLPSTRLECFRFGLSDSKTTEFVLIFSLASHEFNTFSSSYGSGCSTRLVVCAYDRRISKSIPSQSYVRPSLLSRSSYTMHDASTTLVKGSVQAHAKRAKSHQYFSTSSCRWREMASVMNQAIHVIATRYGRWMNGKMLLLTYHSAGSSKTSIIYNRVCVTRQFMFDRMLKRL